MILRLAGNHDWKDCWEFALNNGGQLLQSYWDFIRPDANIGRVRLKRTIKPKKEINLFLDSGAFSAFTQGVEINIREYIVFIKEHEQYLEVYANLDVIGDAEATLKNQTIMEAAGLTPLPCFHQGSPYSYLQNYIDNYDYVALGGLAGGRYSRDEVRIHLDKCFSEFICDKKGMPQLKVHGFGLTSNRFLWRYPWYSVDSTSWVLTGRLGSVLVPKYKNGKWNHREDPWKVGVSDRSPSKKEAGKHFSTYSQMEREVIQSYLDYKGYSIGRSSFRMEDEDYKLEKNERWNGKAKDGKREVEVIEEPGLCNDYKKRDELNIIYYLDLEKAFPPWPYPMEMAGKRKGLF
jgi:hypothetical protein